ncbi:GNAT family N-acetyltransferase [Actinoplanes xinjiangensis]|uniref:Acetyltransferase (GNAT) family protein n=1 Tax=Actinoplanes xinjiangensis TaxID=512350 RepID=A0A316F436_9ACTN|nr:GNAT family N-acetyltransferase [Actinoplanes xinjiangensis]PWK39873.1 acetyltransferase (GNAT) family protein [Actinoplanes xinjiangensis]GIF42840.1 hypothetical protein Axi01nite_71510 [Actinoplanes xinjiangensis]
MTFQDPPAVPATVDALTVDGGIVSIRPITSRDRRAITRLYADASPENLRLRFLALPGSATLAAESDRLCRPESDGFLALLAYEDDRLVGVASCERLGDLPRAEFAVFIADRDHGRGIGTLLLEHLTARAHRLGITELVVGADHSPGRQALHALLTCGFTGRLYPISRAGAPLDGQGTSRSLRDLPEPVDLLVIAIPSDQVADVLADGAAAGAWAWAAILLSSGLGEAGAAGRQRLAAVPRLARSHGIRLVGPNSLGVVNTDPRVRLDACAVPVLSRRPVGWALRHSPRRRPSPFWRLPEQMRHAPNRVAYRHHRLGVLLFSSAP